MALINGNQLTGVRMVRFYPYFQNFSLEALLEEFIKTGVYPHRPHPLTFRWLPYD